MENVKGLLSAKKADNAERGSVFQDILEGLGKPTETLETLGVKKDDCGNKLTPVEYRLMPLVPPEELFGFELRQSKALGFCHQRKGLRRAPVKRARLHSRRQARRRHRQNRTTKVQHPQSGTLLAIFPN